MGLPSPESSSPTLLRASPRILAEVSWPVQPSAPSLPLVLLPAILPHRSGQQPPSNTQKLCLTPYFPGRPPIWCLGCFHIFAAQNFAAVNSLVQIFVFLTYWLTVCFQKKNVVGKKEWTFWRLPLPDGKLTAEGLEKLQFHCWPIPTPLVTTGDSLVSWLGFNYDLFNGEKKLCHCFVFRVHWSSVMFNTFSNIYGICVSSFVKFLLWSYANFSFEGYKSIKWNPNHVYLDCFWSSIILLFLIYSCTMLIFKKFYLFLCWKREREVGAERERGRER